MRGHKFLTAGLRGFMPVLANDDWKSPPPIPIIRDDTEMVRKLQAELAAVEREETTCCILFVKLDSQLGGTEEAAHKAVGERFSRSLRPYDGLFVVGAERYLISLPHIKTEDTITVMERLRSTIAEEPMDVPGVGAIAAKVVIGGAMMEAGVPLDANIERANQALMVTRRSGHPPVCLWSPKLAVG